MERVRAQGRGDALRPLSRRVKREAGRERHPAARLPLRRIGARLGEASSDRPMLRSREHFSCWPDFGSGDREVVAVGLTFCEPPHFRKALRKAALPDCKRGLESAHYWSVGSLPASCCEFEFQVEPGNLKQACPKRRKLMFNLLERCYLCAV